MRKISLGVAINKKAPGIGIDKKKKMEDQTTNEKNNYGGRYSKYASDDNKFEKLKNEIESYRNKIAETYLELKKDYDEKLVMATIKRNKKVKMFYLKYFQENHSSIEKFIEGTVNMYLRENKDMDER